MPNIVAVDQQSKGNIKELGQLIRDCRGTLSQSKLAKKVGLPRSNMKYIEDGVNAPTAEVYEKLIDTLKPDPETYLPNYHKKQGFSRCNAKDGRS